MRKAVEPEREHLRFLKLYRCECACMPEDRSAELKVLAADCIGLATGTTDPIARAAFLAMAQRLLDLAHEPLGTRRFQELLKDFNQRQMDQDWRRLPLSNVSANTGQSDPESFGVGTGRV